MLNYWVYENTDFWHEWWQHYTRDPKQDASWRCFKHQWPVLRNSTYIVQVGVSSSQKTASAFSSFGQYGNMKWYNIQVIYIHVHTQVMTYIRRCTTRTRIRWERWSALTMHGGIYNHVWINGEAIQWKTCIRTDIHYIHTNIHTSARFTKKRNTNTE